MNVGIQVLKVMHYGPTEEDNRMVTISPVNVLMLAAPLVYERIQDREVKRVTVLMIDGGETEVCINDMDLDQLEQAVGAYGLPY
jgi:hypothetical protein